MNYKDTEWKEGLVPLLNYLNDIAEPAYRDFSKKITPGNFTMLGVRIPTLKKIAKSISQGDYKTFLTHSDRGIYELKILKGLVIGNIKSIEEYKEYFEQFLSLIDNWAVCDIFISSSKIIKKDRPYYLELCKELLKTDDEFKNRVAFVILLNYYVDEQYLDIIFDTIDDYKSEHYYANMALAWLLSVIFVNFPKETKEYLEKNKFDKNVTKYMIRKIKDSYRVCTKDKEWLKTYIENKLP